MTQLNRCSGAPPADSRSSGPAAASHDGRVGGLQAQQAEHTAVSVQYTLWVQRVSIPIIVGGGRGDLFLQATQHSCWH